MDAEVSAVDAQLRRLFDEALNTISTLRGLGAPGTRPKASELSKSFSGTCKQMRGHLRGLEQLVDEQDTDDATLQVEHLVKEHKIRYARLRTEQEDAVAAMKKNSELAWREKRQELLAGGVSKSQIRDGRSAVAAFEKTTEALRRTRQVMTEQIGLTEANTEVIGSSTSVLKKTKEELKSQRGLFTSSRRLLTSMSWSDLLDKIVLYGGVTFFLLVVVYILQKRMLGLTPQFVKSTISQALSGSVDRASAIYSQYLHSAKPPVDDPTKSFIPDFDDLATSEMDEDLIKAWHEEPVLASTQELDRQKDDVQDVFETPSLAQETEPVSMEAAEVVEAEKKDDTDLSGTEFPEETHNMLREDVDYADLEQKILRIEHELPEGSPGEGQEDDHLVVPKKQPPDVSTSTAEDTTEEDPYLDDPSTSSPESKEEEEDPNLDDSVTTEQREGEALVLPSTSNVEPKVEEEDPYLDEEDEEEESAAEDPKQELYADAERKEIKEEL